MLLQLSGSFKGDFWGMNDLNCVITIFCFVKPDKANFSRAFFVSDFYTAEFIRMCMTYKLKYWPGI